ncbi:MAG TPA: PaaI family thioesterase [Rhizomicrobium sp.]|jgi:uncharacterized protein (TIGR00369 family)
MMPPPGYTKTDLIDPFEIHVGPIYERTDNGTRSFLLIVDDRHVNGRGVVHGGMLMTFADLALGAAAWDAADKAPVVTVSMQSQFLKSARAGDHIEVTPELVRRTRSLVFMRGDFRVSGAVIYSASSVWKLLGQG